jgi:hypothetical protein
MPWRVMSKVQWPCIAIVRRTRIAIDRTFATRGRDLWPVVDHEHHPNLLTVPFRIEQIHIAPYYVDLDRRHGLERTC